MPRQDIHDAVIGAIREVLPAERRHLLLRNEHDIRADLNIDSMSLVVIACHLERTLGTNIAVLAGRIGQIATIGDLCRETDQATTLAAS